MFELNGKNVIITGGAQGIGKEFARRLLQEGCKVCIADVNINLGGETKGERQKQFGVTNDRLQPFLN
jgi:NAD(P)-dependent dehydrogenase (short-subunit alcohol dehydrogenase family)